MKQTIKLNITHPETRRAEVFLDLVGGSFNQLPFSKTDWQLAECIEEGAKLESTGEVPLIITLFFCTSYHDANKIAKANNFPSTDHQKWSLNGGMLYLVESEDSEKVTEVLGIFAGEE